MPLQPLDYHRPPDRATARRRLQSESTRLLQLGPRVGVNPYAAADAVIDLADLNLIGIAEQADVIRIGAQTTLQSLIESPALQALGNGILPQAARLAAHLGLRNVATLGGALAAPDSPPEILLALLALKATISMDHSQPREFAIADHRPAQNDLLLEVVVPRPARLGAALARVARSPLDGAIVAAIAAVTPETACVAVAGYGPGPIYKSQLQTSTAQLDSLVEAIRLAAQPIADYRGSAEYRQAMAGALARRALTAAAHLLTTDHRSPITDH